MTAVFTYRKGKVSVSCTICGWHSGRCERAYGARREWAVHNFEKHPGVFPRENPNINASEKEVGRRRNAADEGAEGAGPSSTE